MKRADLDFLLGHMLDQYPRASDINLTVGKPPQVEVDGVLMPTCQDLGLSKLTPFHTEMVMLNLAGGDRRNLQNLLNHGSCDLSYHLPGRARFRVNVFSQRGTYSVVMRQLPTQVPTIDELKLPLVLKQVAEEKFGIVFVTGATGSGKTTTLAAMLSEINQKKSYHIITLEDPVEYVHPQLQSTFNQRELGLDFDAFANGLRAALRQAPKVILVGEMRDRETVEIGLSAAETGHLVLTTLHTIDAGQTINRIIGMFELEEERLIRIRLADTMRWAISQRLLPKVGGGRIAAMEVMGSNLRVKEAIINGEAEGKTFYEMMQQGKPFGWTTFDDWIIGLYRQGEITEDTAKAYASKRAIVKRGIDDIRAARGEKTSDIDGLRIDRDYAGSID
ncbi:type IV pilus twitching motility protein PilT [Syntrophobacter fumaroxidans]|uniref:Twitching motility protein n=1 Tax=Syntrophobacter fumaroxidans (strain DSM 10017 / MPOB) TaxID=335543 RepID=A0LIX9_SYNFM|nr:PilT/PilU family type 4a pilus ATPase [Syntrophobacter fumaroxidans]ABK17381.1 twitching motility protein [Syntrophobacter fumaroxidans MPOB]